MRVLAIDTALETCAAAVLDTDSGETAGESLPMQRGHAEALLPLIERVMRQSGLPYSALDRIGVTSGPGSFTGLRVGISAARAIALTAGRPVVGVTTLAAFAAPPIERDGKTALIVAIDARHRNVYLQAFAPGGITSTAPRIASIDDAVHAAGDAPVRIVGTAAKMLAAAWPSDAPAPLSVEDLRAPDIAWVARLAAVANESAGKPKPFYLRAPDAQPQDAGRLSRR
jgi:tRNA threonylcarbamoyladenosine biosynthesis protein TsaB